MLQLADVIFPAMRLPEWSTSLVLGLLIIGFPVALVLSWLFDIGPSGVTTASVSSQTMPAADGASIAVLPFPDMSAEKDQEYFCDGLTDELLSVMTRISGLRVASRTSSFSFKGKKTDLKAAAEKMQVAHILEGSVRKSGNRIRVTAQLIEATSDSQLWSETYDRELGDIFAIQDDAARVAKIGVERAERILADYPDNPRACYLGAAGLFILGETDRAIEWTERALDRLENSVVSRSRIMNDPDLEPVRNHPRFKAVLDSLPEN